MTEPAEGELQHEPLNLVPARAGDRHPLKRGVCAGCIVRANVHGDHCDEHGERCSGAEGGPVGCFGSWS